MGVLQRFGIGYLVGMLFKLKMVFKKWFSVGLLHNYIRPEEPGAGMFDDIKVQI